MKLRALLNEIKYKEYQSGPVKSFKKNQVDLNSVIKDPKLLQNCYANARKEFLLRLNNGENVQFYIGTMRSKTFPYDINHGWVVKDKKIVIDTTPTTKVWKNMNEYQPIDLDSFAAMHPDIQYVGIPLESNWVSSNEFDPHRGPKIPVDDVRDFWSQIHKHK